MTDPALIGLPGDVVEQLCSLFRGHPEISSVILYGSRAMGTYKRGSDVDLVLHGGEELTRDILHRVLNEIDDLLLPWSFDIALYSHITNAGLLDHINRVGLSLCS